MIPVVEFVVSKTVPSSAAINGRRLQVDWTSDELSLLEQAVAAELNVAVEHITTYPDAADVIVEVALETSALQASQAAFLAQINNDPASFGATISRRLAALGSSTTVVVSVTATVVLVPFTPESPSSPSPPPAAPPTPPMLVSGQQQTAADDSTTVGIVVPVVLVVVISLILGLLYWRSKGGALRRPSVQKSNSYLKSADTGGGFADIAGAESSTADADNMEYGGNVTPRDLANENTRERASQLTT